MTEVSYRANTDMLNRRSAYQETTEDLVAFVNRLQAEIREKAHQLFPCLSLYYYSERMVKAFENNPLDLVFRMQLYPSAVAPLVSALNANGKNIDVLRQHLRTHEDTYDSLKELELKVDSISVELAERLKVSHPGKFHISSPYHLYKLNFADGDSIPSTLNIESDLLVFTQKGVIFKHDDETYGRRVIYPGTTYWNPHSHALEFDIPFDSSLACCHFDPTVYSPPNFIRFAKEHGLTTIGVCHLFELTQRLIDMNIIGNYGREVDHRAERIQKALS